MRRPLRYIAVARTPSTRCSGNSSCPSSGSLGAAVGPRDVEQLVGEATAGGSLERVVRGAQPVDLLVGGQAFDREVAVLTEERDLLVGDVDLEVGRGWRSDRHGHLPQAWRMELSRMINVGEQTT